MAKIVLDGVTKRYPDGTEAVRDVSLEIEDGEFMILVGPSGCGKSTLLRMIAGLEEISEGDLLIGDQVVNDLDPGERDIAMVFQSYALYPHMTVRDNMGFALKLAKVPKDEIAQRVGEAARVLGLTDYLDRRPVNLSGGQRQRVAMGRAIVRKPQAFLMDEPLSNLDAKLRVQTRAEVARLQARLGTTTVYVTHDQTEAMTLGDRVAVIKAGALQQVGTPMELYETPNNIFVAGFIGSPGMNFVPAKVVGDVVQLPMAEVPVPEAVRAELEASECVIAGIRPEHMSDAALAGSGSGAGAGGATTPFSVEIDLIESLGAETYAHFGFGDLDVQAGDLEELARDAGTSDVPDDRTNFVARLDPDSRVRRGERANLLLEHERIAWFDAASGRRLGAAVLTGSATP